MLQSDIILVSLVALYLQSTNHEEYLRKNHICICRRMFNTYHIPASIYLFKVNKKTTITV